MSEPIPILTLFTLAPTLSQIFAISFINEIFVASIAFAAYFVISAERISIEINLLLVLKKGEYNSFILLIESLLFAPTTTLSGVIKSFIAAPSFKNSGLDTTSNNRFDFLIFNSDSTTFLTLSAVPTGTVDLFTKMISFCIFSPISFATDRTYFKSAEPSSPIGVPTAIKTISASFIPDSKSLVKQILFLLTLS